VGHVRIAVDDKVGVFGGAIGRVERGLSARPLGQVRLNPGAVAGHHPITAYGFGRDDEYREGQLGPRRRASTRDPLHNEDRRVRHTDPGVTAPTGHPVVGPHRPVPTGAQWRKHPRLQPGPERDLIRPAVEQFIAAHQGGRPG
jgi:hypothetical protein